ncbi:secreted glycosidase [Apiospora arundinis]|uniref:Secreted glycosidase n=1 Tax=Apiospora arundinis TaxID=335852 RepID=A0ABR2I0F4_9PEZI
MLQIRRVKMRWLGIAITPLITCAVVSAESTRDYTKHVNLFIGTEGPVPGSAYSAGNVFPGATLPFGAVKVGIDTTRWNTSYSANAGYTPDGNVTAITMLHESGTGGAPTYGLIPQMPLVTLEDVNLFDNLTYMQSRTREDVASVGYYRTHLQNGVTAEMSASMHAGIMRYQYPEKGGRYVLVDLSHFIPSTGKKEQFYSNGFMERSDDGSWYSGYGVYREGWAWGGDYRVYFCGHFDTAPVKTQFFSGRATDPYWPNTTDVKPTFTDSTVIQGGTVGYQFANRIGSLFEFPANISSVSSKVGISWISAEKACRFLEEIPSWDLNATVQAAKDEWNTEVLSKIDVQTDNQTQLEMFYTGLYHSHLLPSDRTGENPNWQSDEPYYDDFYTIWDTFRCLIPLTTLILPKRSTDIVRALIDIWRFERFMPDGRSHNHNGRVQGGSNADNVLADAYVKGLRDGINWTDGYLAMKTNAELQPYNNFDFEDPTGSTKEGRGGLQDWKRYGYVTPARGRCLSKTVDYSLNDFSLSQVARGEAPKDVALYLNRSTGWQKTWNPDVESLNFTGFLAPTHPNGSTQAYDPLSCGACDWISIAYEGVPWEYSFSIPFDMQTLMTKMGGPELFESRLDTMFIPNLTRSNQGGNSAGSTIFNPGNEPSFMTPFLYNYLPRKQHRSVQRSREVVDQYYNNGRSGIPGNDDAGSMSSWLVWNMIGLYPVVTQPVYLVLAPRFEDITVKLGDTGSKLTIKSTGMHQGPYVQSLKVNGQPWTKSWLTHEQLIGVNGDGSLLEFVLGSEKVEWDTGEVPPSPGSLTN